MREKVIVVLGTVVCRTFVPVMKEKEMEEEEEEEEEKLWGAKGK